MTDLKKKLVILIQIVGCQSGVECDIDAILSATSKKIQVLNINILLYEDILYLNNCKYVP